MDSKLGNFSANDNESIYRERDTSLDFVNVRLSKKFATRGDVGVAELGKVAVRAVCAQRIHGKELARL